MNEFSKAWRQRLAEVFEEHPCGQEICAKVDVDYAKLADSAPEIVGAWLARLEWFFELVEAEGLMVAYGYMVAEVRNN